MHPAVYQVHPSDDPQDVIHRAVAALAHGKIVAIPTETVYGFAASALNPSAVARLYEIKERLSTKACALAVKSAEDALDYVPHMSALARRFARRCWPGPVTLVLENSHADSVLYRLPRGVQESVVQQNRVGFRVPADEIALRILRLTVGPLVLTSANVSGRPDATDAKFIDDSVLSKVDMVVDAGPCRFGQSSSVVLVEQNRFTILREGVVAPSVLKQLSQFLVLIVCTGNTCRSPMAERLLRTKVAEHLGCTVEELESRGVAIVSAGIAAFPGGRAAREAIDTLAERGVDLSDHCSQPLTDRLVRHADLILTMTAGHRQAVISQWPEATPRTFMFRPDHRDISDPIGQSPAAYAACAEEIEESLSHWVTQIRPPETE
jgi:protein-tyrosine phosphatase